MLSKANQVTGGRFKREVDQMESASHEVRITPSDLIGTLAVPSQPIGTVLFAHGSGSSRLSPRNVYVAAALQKANIATLLFDLLTEREALDRDKVFDVELLGARLGEATGWLQAHEPAGRLPLGYFGASTGAAAALIAAAGEPSIGAVVSRGGRPDLADRWLARVRTPTLLIVGGEDGVVVDLNREAYARLRCEKEITIVPGATHLFEEPGALDRVVELATSWFVRYLPAADKRRGDVHR
jgi:putative phosphoribosyl transferase